MKCEKCVEQGLESRIDCGNTIATLMGFRSYYDRKGLYHVHDPNWMTTQYRCSNGHRFERSTMNKCPSCNFGSEEMVHFKDDNDNGIHT